MPLEIHTTSEIRDTVFPICWLRPGDQQGWGHKWKGRGTQFFGGGDIQQNGGIFEILGMSGEALHLPFLLIGNPANLLLLVLTKIFFFFERKSHFVSNFKCKLEKGLFENLGLVVWVCYIAELLMIYYLSQSKILFGRGIFHSVESQWVRW